VLVQAHAALLSLLGTEHCDPLIIILLLYLGGHGVFAARLFVALKPASEICVCRAAGRKVFEIKCMQALAISHAQLDLLLWECKGVVQL